MNDYGLFDKYAYRIIINAALFMLLLGTVFYHFVEKLRWIDAWYFSVITLATVGYGDISPKTDLGKLFTTFYVLVGVGIIVVFTSTLVKRAGQRRATKLKNK